jgi:hypothetical protein
MLQTILILFAAGAVGGLTIGRRVAMSEVEMMWRLAKTGVRRRNKRWEEIKANFKKNDRWAEIKKNYKTNESWEKTKQNLLDIKKDLRSNEKWNAVKLSVKSYRNRTDERWKAQKDKWESLKQEQKRDRYNVSAGYLTKESLEK